MCPQSEDQTHTRLPDVTSPPPQGTTHDAIEDARTALLLYERYKLLVREGTFDEKLAELYRWGNQHGWEPVVMDKDGKPMVAPTGGL